MVGINDPGMFPNVALLRSPARPLDTTKAGMLLTTAGTVIDTRITSRPRGFNSIPRIGVFH
jgi:hypothetical protein